MTTMTKTEIVTRFTEQDIFVNSSIMVQDLCNSDNGQGSGALLPCMVSDDYETPAREALQNGTPAFAFYAAEHVGLSLFTKSGAEVVDDDMADELDESDVDIERLLQDIEELDDSVVWVDICENADIEPHMLEALQHWLVSDWLANELEGIGALVARDIMGFNVWGRTECGQSLTMDADLNRIADLLISRN